MFLFDLGLTGPNLAGVHHYYVVVLQCLIYLAVGLSVLVAADRIVHVLQYLYWQNCDKFKAKRPEDRYVFSDLPDMTRDGSSYPMVAVQLPMFNECAVCQQVIDRVCEMHWPEKRVYVQVLDDSKPLVAMLAKALLKHPGIAARLEGHANSRCGLECDGSTPCTFAAWIFH